MRGRTDEQASLFHIFHVEDRIRPDHPLRDIKRRTDRILETLAADFAKAYSNANDSHHPPPDGNGFKPRNVAVDFHGQKRTGRFAGEVD